MLCLVCDVSSNNFYSLICASNLFHFILECLLHSHHFRLLLFYWILGCLPYHSHSKPLNLLLCLLDSCLQNTLHSTDCFHCTVEVSSKHTFETTIKTTKPLHICEVIHIVHTTNPYYLTNENVFYLVGDANNPSCSSTFTTRRSKICFTQSNVVLT